MAGGTPPRLLTGIGRSVSRRFLEPNPDTTAILWNKLNTCILKRILNAPHCAFPELLVFFEAAHCLLRHIRRRCQFSHAPSQRRSSELTLDAPHFITLH